MVFLLLILCHTQKYMHMCTHTCTHVHISTHAHTHLMHTVLARMAAELTVLRGQQCSESSAPVYSHTHQARFAVYIFNHWIRVWEPTETTELKLPGSNCWKNFRKG